MPRPSESAEPPAMKPPSSDDQPERPSTVLAASSHTSAFVPRAACSSARTREESAFCCGGADWNADAGRGRKAHGSRAAAVFDTPPTRATTVAPTTTAGTAMSHPIACLMVPPPPVGLTLLAERFGGDLANLRIPVL